jgi:ribosomal protein S18 acetylase RimI-like enzyme
MNIDLRILDWELADLNALAELVWQSRMASPLGVEGQAAKGLQDYIENGQSRWPDSILLGAYRKEQLVGWLALIAIVPGSQRQGWGRRLVSASVRAAELEADHIFSIGVDLSNQVAYQLYRSMGFEPRTKLVTHIWKNGS